MPAGTGNLAGVGARLRAMLVPYEADLEWATIYGNAALRRPGASAHNWFAFVKPASKHVSLFLLPVHQHPQLLDGCSPVLLARKTGEATFTFKELPDDLAADVEALLARAFEVYVGVSATLREVSSTDRGRDGPRLGSVSPSPPGT